MVQPKRNTTLRRDAGGPFWYYCTKFDDGFNWGRQILVADDTLREEKAITALAAVSPNGAELDDF